MRHSASTPRWARPWLVALVVLVALTASPAVADLTGPQPNDRQVTLVVTSLMRREHLSKQNLDDNISRRTLKSFLKSIDPMKLYFYQSDIDEFKAKEDELDDMLKKGDISFAYTVYQRFLARVDERVKTIHELLAEQHDFTADEELNIDFDKLTHPATADEARNRWRKRIKYDLLVLKSDDKTGDEALDRLRRRYQSFAKRMHQTSSDELLEMFLTAMTTSYDPHTTYMSPSSLDNFRIVMGLKLEGIGAALQMTDGYTVVTKVIPGGAADKGGKLKPEDRIVSVGQGEDGEMVDVVDLKLGDVVKLIRGPAGSTVRLGVIPAGANELKVYDIVRAEIELKDEEARGVIFDDAKKANGAPLKVGVINLPSFYMDMEGARRGVADFKSTTRDVRKLLEEFNSKGVDLVVLDLRNNGGGSLTEAINLTGLFIDQGPVVQVKDADGRVQHYDDLDRGMTWKGPLVVVTNKFSASASEILAGAIQDYGRGIIVGDTATHGKGTVQSLLDLGSQLFRIPNPPNLGALKITMQQFYRPNGDSTQKRGVLADVPLPWITNHMDISEGDLDYALEFDRIPAADFTKVSLVRPEFVKALNEASAARRAQSPDFQKLAKNIERYQAQKERKRITLHEERFFAERAEYDADKEEEKQFEEQANGSSKEVVKRDYYFNEVLAIAGDYYRLLESNRVATTGR